MDSTAVAEVDKGADETTFIESPESCNVCTTDDSECSPASAARPTQGQLLKMLAARLGVPARSIQKAGEILNKCPPEMKAALMESGSKFTINDAYNIRNQPHAIQYRAIIALKSGQCRSMTAFVKELNLPSAKPFDAIKESRSLRQVVRRLAETWPENRRSDLVSILRKMALEIEQDIDTTTEATELQEVG